MLFSFEFICLHGGRRSIRCFWSSTECFALDCFASFLASSPPISLLYPSFTSLFIFSSCSCFSSLQFPVYFYFPLSLSFPAETLSARSFLFTNQTFSLQIKSFAFMSCDISSLRPHATCPDSHATPTKIPTLPPRVTACTVARYMLRSELSISNPFPKGLLTLLGVYVHLDECPRHGPTPDTVHMLSVASRA